MSIINKIRVGSKFSRHSFGEVLAIERDGIRIQNKNGLNWLISENIVENEFKFADVVDTEQSVNATDIAEKFINNKYIVMTVNFNKKIDSKQLESKILELYPNKNGILLSEQAFKTKVREHLSDLIRGEERTIVGYHKGHTDINGRMFFIDMEAGDNQVRLVDPRTINWLVLDGVKYIVQ